MTQKKKHLRSFKSAPAASNQPARSRSEIRTERVRDRLLDAAGELFMERGYEATSMSEIARYAQASKETFYRHFPGKEDLFKAVVLRGASKVSEELSALLPTHEPPEKALAAFGELFLDRVLSAPAISFQRIIMMERDRLPELVQALRAGGRERVRASLAHYLSEQVARGRLRTMDTAVGARHFLDLIAADLVWIATRCGGPKPTRAQIRQRVKEGIQCFLCGYQSE